VRLFAIAALSLAACSRASDLPPANNCGTGPVCKCGVITLGFGAGGCTEYACKPCDMGLDMSASVDLLDAGVVDDMGGGD
jgi:hypothetical protein